MRTMTIDHLTIGYRKTPVAANLTAVLHSGELVCLIGANGVGKSTLLKTMAGFLPPVSGKVDCQMCLPHEGQQPQPTSNGTTQPPTRRRRGADSVSIVLTERPDIQNLTVSEVVALGRTPHTGFWGRLRPADRRIIDDCLALVGITHLATRMIQTLSDGEHQKVMIARALAQQTPVILLDEPTAFLDYPTKKETFCLLQQLAHQQQKAVLLSTHDVDMAMNHADTVWMMTREGITAAPPCHIAATTAFRTYTGRT